MFLAISGTSIIGCFIDSSGKTHGFAYNGIWMTINDPLGTNGTFTLGYNEPSTVVGYFIDSNSRTNGFISTGNVDEGIPPYTGTFTTLDDPLGTSYTKVMGVSGSNIVGTYSNGTQSYGFVATPVPEPATWIDVLLSVYGLILLRKRI